MKIIFLAFAVVTVFLLAIDFVVLTDKQLSILSVLLYIRMLSTEILDKENDGEE